MKIAMFADNFYPELSGVSDSIIDLAKELARLGHAVDIYAPKYSKKDFTTYNVPAEELDLGKNTSANAELEIPSFAPNESKLSLAGSRGIIKIHRLCSFPYPTPTKQGRLVIPTLLRWILMRKNKPDVIHVHDCFGVGIEGMIAAKFLKVPLVGTNHTPITEFLKYGPLQNKFIDKAALNFVSWFYNHCDFVSAPCNIILEEMKVNKFKKPCQALSNPIDLKNFYPATPEEKIKMKKEFNLSDFTVLYTGRLATEKHVDVIIQAINEIKNKIPNINFAITGHGSAAESLKKLAEDLGLKEQIKFFGTVSAVDHAKIYKAADVFAIASTAEMQSLSMMKAMAGAVPVIGVNAWALPEYINEKNGFVLEPGDFKGIAEKILYLFEHPEQRKSLGQGGLDFVQKFSPTNITNAWVEIYKKICKK
jgi:glycosyltransferase involved in cell wall biosynthesis